MTSLNTDLLARLLNYGKVSENQTLEPAKAAGNDAIGSFTFKGRADMPNRLTNNMGDNPMVDPTVDEDARQLVITADMLSKTKTILNNIGIEDSDLALGNVRLKSAQACMKLVKQVTGKTLPDPEATNFCAELVQQLSIKLSEDVTDDADEDQLNEFFIDTPVDARFTYTVDTLGDVMVKDTETDRSVYLRGADAAELIGQLEMHGGSPETEQELLSQYQHVMEMGEAVSMDEDVKMSNYFGAGPIAVDAMSALAADVQNMKSRMQKLRAVCTHKHDVGGVFAADTMLEEISRMEHVVTDYMAKMND